VAEREQRRIEIRAIELRRDERWWAAAQGGGVAGDVAIFFFRTRSNFLVSRRMTKFCAVMVIVYSCELPPS
jgi:hypothetical protein